MKDRIRIATRKSPLALWQAEYVRDRLLALYPGLSVELVTMTTKGDRILDAPLAKIGGKGLFVKELEAAMLEDRADIAVHSMKDVPMDFPPGLMLSTICEREDPRDAFVSNDYARLEDLPEHAVVGTSSLRRQCQIRAFRPDLQIVDLRGNVNTRLAKLDAREYDAIILATAGLLRLGMEDRITGRLATTQLLPAVGQGAVGIECREDDADTRALLAPLNDAATWTRVSAERAMNHRLAGGCQVPIAGFATLTDGHLEIRGLVGSPDGRSMLRDQVSGPAAEAVILGTELGERLLAAGADRILAAVYGNA